MEREMTEGNRQAAVFLDRDGTINEEVGYIDRMEKLQLIPGAAEAIRLINQSGMKTIVITNQSGVARGFFDEEFVEKTHTYLRDILRAEGALIDAFYFCPHHPKEGRAEYLKICDCRKPAPGMLLRAAEELRIDPNHSYMVGDTLWDIEAGVRAGTRGVLVRTGCGEASVASLDAAPESRDGVTVRPAHIAADLREAVAWIMEDRKGTGR
jgi:D-glycero-D-manno-heptose 1,7-bisphosphate phosphatase